MIDYNKMIDDWEKAKDIHCQLNNEEGDRMVAKCERVMRQILEIQRAEDMLEHEKQQLETIITGLTGNIV